MTIQRTSLIAALTAVGALGPVARSAESVAVDNDLVEAEEDGRNWASYGLTFSEDHFSPLTEITGQNVDKLRLAWSYDLNVPLRADSQPLEVNGVVYVATGLSEVQALDAVTGKLLWRYDPKLTAIAGRKLRPSWGIRGIALWKDLLRRRDGQVSMALLHSARQSQGWVRRRRHAHGGQDVVGRVVEVLGWRRPKTREFLMRVCR